MTDSYYSIDKLDRTSLFKDLSKNAFKEIVDSGYLKKLEVKNFLFHQGDKAQYAYLLLKGRLKLFRMNERGEEAILHYMGAHELVAVVATLYGHTYPASAEIIQEGEAICWDGKMLRNFMHIYPAIAINALDIILERLKDVQNRFLELSTKRVEQRIARTLLRIMKRGGTKIKTGIRIDFPLSRQDIAEHAGTTLYTVSRTISAWEKQGLVITSRENIIISDLHALVLIAEDLQ